MLNKKNEKSNPDVFEMILSSNNKNSPPIVEAVPSNYDIPEDWHRDHQEGQLAVDVIDSGKDIIVISTMAGSDSNELEVYVHNDLLTIRGLRSFPIETNAEMSYLYQECYWGRFSRTVVLPVDVKGDLAKAAYTNGILSITIPKRKSTAKIEIKIVDN